MKSRFRNPLRPAGQAKLSGEVRRVSDDGAHADLAIAIDADGEDVVTASATVRVQR